MGRGRTPVLFNSFIVELMFFLNSQNQWVGEREVGSTEWVKAEEQRSRMEEERERWQRQWCGLERKGGGKLRCWIGSEALMDQWDTWIHILHSFSLKLAFSPDSLCLLLFKAHAHTNKIHTHTRLKKQKRQRLGLKQTNLVKLVRKVQLNMYVMYITAVYNSI